MNRRALTVLIITSLFWIFSLVLTPNAFALTSVKLFDLGYQECPPELAEGMVTAGGYSMAANCFLVTGKAENKSGKYVVDADVFGRIYDANNNSVFQNRGRVGTILEVPPGTSDFQIRISVPASLPTPLKLKQFKASGFAYKVRPYYYQ